MSDNSNIVGLVVVAGLALLTSRTVTKVEDIRAGAAVETQRLRSTASIEAAQKGLVLPQCPQTVSNNRSENNGIKFYVG